jgi:hypothetical protein
MSDLKKHLKKSKTEVVTTSVNITKWQKDFIERHNLNLSSLVRDWLTKLIKNNSDGSETND